MKEFSHPLKIINFLIVSLVPFVPAVSVASMSLTGNWVYQNSKSSAEQKTEGYTASFSKAGDLNEVMKADLGMRVNRNITESSTTDNFAPSLGYYLANDIFSFGLNGYANKTQHSSRPDSLSRNVVANLNSSWKAKSWVPALNLNHNKSWSEDSRTPHLNDSTSSSSNAGFIWDFRHTKINYSYNSQDSEDFVSSAESLTTSHNAHLSTSARFWGQKGSISFSSGYRYSESENSLPVKDGFALLERNASAYFAEVDSNNFIGNNATFTLANAGGLTNNDKSDDVIVTDNDLNDFLIIAVKTNLFEPINKIYLYVDSDSTLVGTDAAKFTWDVYVSDDNLNWTLHQGAAVFSYSAIEERFEVDITAYSGDFYLALVAKNDADPVVVTFSEVEVFQEIDAAGSRVEVNADQTSINNELGISLQVKPNLQLTSNLMLGHYDSSEGRPNRQVDLSTGVTWGLRDDISVRLGNNYRSNKSEGSDESVDINYSISMTAPPMKTVDSIFSATRREKYRGSRKLSVLSSYNVQLLAALYTDLDARYSFSYAINDDNEAGTNTSSSNSDFNLNARLVPGLSAAFNWRYSKSSGQAASNTSNQSVNWRLSDLVSLRGGLSETWASGGDSVAMNFDVGAAISRNMQLYWKYNRTIRPDSQYSTSLDLNWAINRHLSMLTSGSYRIRSDGDEDWSIVSRLSASYSAM